MVPFRKFSLTLLASLLIVATLAVVIWFWSVGRPASGDPLVQVSPSPSSLPPAGAEPGTWGAVAAAAGPSGAAVQAFQGGRLYRSGTATVVSSDGLLVTVFDAAPLASPAATFQVATPDGRLLAARAVARDARNNLVLLKVSASDLTIAPLAASVPVAGAELALVGGFVRLSAYTPTFAHSWVSYETPAYVVLDAVAASVPAGARALGTDGRQAGVVYVRNGQIRMVPAALISSFVDSYLQSTAPNR